MRANPRPQEMYRHFKGNIYQIRCLAKHSETREMMVVYQAMYGTFDIYVRPLDMFMEEVDHVKYPDIKQKYRFELLQDTEAWQTEPTNGQTDEPRKVEASRAELSAQTDMPGKAKVFQAESVSQTQIRAAVDLPMADCHKGGEYASMQADGLEQTTESDEQLHIDPLVMEFLDAGTYEQRLNILAALRHRITNEMINTMAVSVDLEIKDGDVQERYEELKRCLLTFEKYECNRLR